MEQNELEESYTGDVEINTPDMVYKEMRDIKNWNKEVFVAFYLNSKNKIISREVISIGTINSTIIHPREVFRTAIIRNAVSIILAHNHPSGDSIPSDEDINTTKKLREAGEIIGITLLDHVVVSKDGYYSLNDKKNI